MYNLKYKENSYVPIIAENASTKKYRKTIV